MFASTVYIFQNYSNSRKWYDEGILAAFVFGDTSTAEITDVIFSCLSDFDASLDLIHFIESSLSSSKCVCVLLWTCVPIPNGNERY